MTRLPILITPLLAAVLVLTVIGWRLRDGQLSLPQRTDRWLFVAVAGTFVVGIAISPINRPLGLVVAGIGLLGLAPGLVRLDAARTELRSGGLTAFSAWSTTMGYLWLGVSGVPWVALGAGTAGSFAWREMALDGNVAALAAFVIIEVVAVRRSILATRPRERAVL